MDYAAAQDDAARLPGDAGIVQEAIENHKVCREWQGTEDERSREDIKFANADARNAWQWPTKMYAARTGGDIELPCLTINQTRVYNDQIINSISKNAVGVKVRPTGGKASYQSAKVMMNIIRRIENISAASRVYRKICEHQVDGGVGYCIIETRYVSERSFDQDIFLTAANDPTAVYLDPWNPDDPNFGFVFERMSRKSFNRKYPKWKNKVGSSPVQSGLESWISDKEIMVAKYYRKKQRADMLVSYTRPGDDAVEKLASEIRDESGQELLDQLLDDIKEGRIDGRTRQVSDDKVEWFQIGGDQIIKRGEWAGKYIPIIRCVGREIIIDGTLDRKGNTRAQIDAQRMLNYNASSSVQSVATQTKTQWLASSRATEGQNQWKTANTDNFAVLMWNDLDDEQSDPALAKIPPPQRIDPPVPSPAFTQGMQDAERHLMMVNGQFQANPSDAQGESPFPQSGRAINERKEAGAVATYHFPEHMGDMKRAIGVQLLNLIPKIYDTRRALHVQDEKGEKHWIQIDPNQVDAVQELEHLRTDEEAIRLAFNPSVGEYECVSDPGPDYATQRQEQWNAMTQLLAANKELAAIGMDLLLKAGDFPGADELSERYLKEIKAQKPYLFDSNLDPQMAALSQQNQRLVALNAEMMTKLADMNLRLRGRDEKRDIEAHKADTDRMKVQLEFLLKTMLTPQQKAQMEHELEAGLHQHVFDLIQQANEPRVTNGSAE